MHKSHTHVISLVNQKGGVGKTTISFNLAHGLVRHGKKVLVVDNDPQGNLTSSLLPRGVRPEIFSVDLYEERIDRLQSVKENLFITAGDDSLETVQYEEESAAQFANVIGKISNQGKLDYIIIDCSPQITNLTLAGIMAANHLLIPIQPSKYSIDGLRKLLVELKKMRATGATKASILGFILNLVSSTKLHRQTAQQLKKKFPKYVMESVVRKRTAYEESPIKTQSIWDYGQDEKAEIEMNALIREIIKKVEG